MPEVRTKRIVLLVPAFPSTSETFIVSKFAGLLERGWDVHLVCYLSKPEDWEKFPELQADERLMKRVHRVWRIKPKWLTALLLPAALIRGLVRAPHTAWRYLTQGFRELGWGVLQNFYLDLEMICLKPDILHIEFGAFAVGRTYLKGLLDCALAVSFRGYDLNFSGTDQPDYYAQVWQQADACHFLGEDLWQRAQQRGCPASMPHKLIPPAFDFRHIPAIHRRGGDADGSASKPIRILSVGRLEWKKGYEFALQAVKTLKDMGVECLYQIVGVGQYHNALYFARHQMGLEQNVEFCGALKHHQVLSRLSEADIFLHASLSEGFCNAVIEAQAMRVPVVCSDAGGLNENVADGISGFVVPRRDPQALAEKMALLAGDPMLRQSMGEAGYERVKTLFQLEPQLTAFEEFYKMIAGKG